MEGGEGIIGLPDDGTVQKYTLGNNPRVELMPDSQQTLMSTSITQEGGKTIMEFAKYLSEPGEHEINPNGKNTFLYALGSGNSLGYHGANRNPFTVELDAEASASDGTPAPTPDGDGMTSTGETGGTKTISPTPAIPERGDPDPAPPTTDSQPVPATGESSGMMKKVASTILGASAVALWFGM